ncbi:MAG: alanine racemase [Anaerolineales bacterium]|nr:alanine racemase [Anaerolineales bacterium]
MPQTDAYATWAEVDLGAIRANLRQFARREAAVMAVVKANAYGHGAVPVARAALEAGAVWCGVARLGEALELRRAGLDCPILILGPVPLAAVPAAIADNISLTVWHPDQVGVAESAARQIGRPARLHLKVDTGMRRLGASPSEVLALARRVHDADGVELEGIFSHMARAGEADPAPSRRQQALFQEVLAGLSSAGLRPTWCHLANTAAALRWPEMDFDLVRIGLGLYGMQASDELDLGSGLHPALGWKAQVSQVKAVAAGEGIGYGQIYTTGQNEAIATVSVGYGDGFRRWPGARVLIDGRPAEVVGRVSMDQITVRLGSGAEARPGDEVVLIGRQGAAEVSAESLADVWGTINYEVTCGISARVPRLYR